MTLRFPSPFATMDLGTFFVVTIFFETYIENDSYRKMTA